MDTPVDDLSSPLPSVHSSHVTNLINSTPPRGVRAPSRTILSDRFIPARSSSNLDLVHLDTSKDDELTPYKMLLRAAIFGPPSTPDVADRIGVGGKSGGGGTGIVGYGSRNVFRYKIETRQPLDTSPFRFGGGSGEGVGIGVGIAGSSDGVKSMRKVPRSPYKVRDC